MAQRKTHELVLIDKQRETPRISLFTFGSADGETLAEWGAGSHLTVHLADGMNRDYSLCGIDPRAGNWTVAVQRETTGRGGSVALHDHLDIGDRVTVSEPLTTFSLAPAPRYLLIAGGIGITPLIAMAESLQRQALPWHLVYLVRERVNAAFLERITTPNNVELWVSEEQGRFDLAALRAHTDPDTAVYACGPTGLLAELDTLWADIPHMLNTEHFAGTGVGEAGESFEVELAVSGKVIQVGPHDTILAAVEAAEPSISVYQSCLEGVCGSCETRVIAGTPDHRDLVLTAKQRERNDRMMICVSRSKEPRLVLEL